jgi:hypothetical protein
VLNSMETTEKRWKHFRLASITSYPGRLYI